MQNSNNKSNVSILTERAYKGGDGFGEEVDKKMLVTVKCSNSLQVKSQSAHSTLRPCQR